MGDSKPYLTGGRCGACLQPFRITEDRTAEGGIVVRFDCPSCHSSTAVPFSADDLASWAARQRRKSGRPAVDPERFRAMREEPVKSQWRLYRGPSENLTVASAEPDIGGSDE